MNASESGWGWSPWMNCVEPMTESPTGPLDYQDLRAGIRRALLRRFPYAIYFAVENDTVLVVAVLHASRDPAEWQRRRG